MGSWLFSEPHSTKEIDLFIRSELKNSEAVFRALAEFGAPLAGFTSAHFRENPTSVFQVGFTPVRAYILQSIDGVDQKSSSLEFHGGSRSSTFGY